MKENKYYKWRKLDNSAKIFPLSSGAKYSTVFRLSAVLKEDIDENILNASVKQSLKKYDFFQVKMKRGFFWYYLERNMKKPIIEEEKEYPCKYINPETNNEYLFKVTYFKNKINIDIAHILADGNSGAIFFKEIIYSYIELKHKDIFINKNIRQIRKLDFSEEDSYITNYDKNCSKGEISKKAYEIKGNKIKLGGVSVIHQIMNLEKLKQICDERKVTITQYLTSVLIYSILMTNYSKKNKKDIKPIKVCVPVNLRKYYPSKTLSNFFSYISVDYNVKDEKYSFNDIIDDVKIEFANKLRKEEISKTMSTNVKIGTNFFIKTIPLFLKKIIVRASYIEIRKYSTVTLSNIGRMGIIGKYQDYIDYCMILLSPDPVEKIKCSACSFENKLVFTFTSILDNNEIEKFFYQFIKKNGIEIYIESNGVLNDISQ